jgi:ribonuclease P protein component
VQLSRALAGPFSPGGAKKTFTRAPQGLGSSTGEARPPRACLLLEDSREAHLSAPPHEPRPHPRLPRPHEHRQRPQGDQQSASQGASSPERHGLQEVSGSAVAAGAAGPASVELSRRFTSRDRVRKRFEFRNARDRGRRVHTKSFVVWVAPSEQPQARLGLTVSRQVGNAVRRNRVKRLVREVFRQHRELFPERTDIVVVAKKPCAVERFDDVYAELAQAARVMKTPPRKTRSGGRP